MKFLHPAMRHDHDTDFTRWLHPAIWHVALESWVKSPSGRTLQCDTWLWDDIPLNLPGCSTPQCCRWFCDNMPMNSPKRPPYWNSTSAWFWFRPYHRIRHVILYQSAIILSKSDHPWQKKMTSCPVSWWRISCHLGFYGSNNGFFEKRMYDSL